MKRFFIKIVDVKPEVFGDHAARVQQLWRIIGG
jgi:hypothetical protein